MMCRDPFIDSTGRAYGCGQCRECRYNRRRVWMHRIMLEASQYKDNAFVGLSYDDAHLPEGGTLVPKDLRDFLNRLRGRFAPERFRFFAVGEYGDVSWRPHYHLVLFGVPTCVRGRTRRRVGSGRPVWNGCCEICTLIGETWDRGDVDLGTVTDDSAAYMAGYVVKKMTSPDDPRLEGRYPEFSRQSNRGGGIGYGALWDVADALMRYELEEKLTDVPSQLQHGMKRLPLGRYLRGKLREMVGRDARASQAVVDAIAEELLPLRLAAKASEENPSLKARIVEANEQPRRNAEARMKLRKGKRSL